MTILEIVLRAAVCALCVYIAAEDVRHMRIRNSVVIAVTALFLPMLFLLTPGQIAAQLICATLALVVGAVLFYARLFGGGDAKLIAALSLWVAPASLPAFLMIMTICGGIIALAAIFLRKRPLLQILASKTPVDGWFAALARGESVVPYGIAISIAALLTIF